jgi:hypothetical protein
VRTEPFSSTLVDESIFVATRACVRTAKVRIRMFGCSAKVRILMFDEVRFRTHLPLGVYENSRRLMRSVFGHDKRSQFSDIDTVAVIVLVVSAMSKVSS